MSWQERPPSVAGSTPKSAGLVGTTHCVKVSGQGALPQAALLGLEGSSHSAQAQLGQPAASVAGSRQAQRLMAGAGAPPAKTTTA
ncbi:MAG: hypothetical protein IPG96_04290 [Proteobacteria bacterium]|nr:hypothetical protein [Pseudomonadota bacterium]